MTPARGRPLRFLAVLIAGWTAVRVAMLWPGAPPVTPPRSSAAPARAPTPTPESAAAPVVMAAIPDVSSDVGATLSSPQSTRHRVSRPLISRSVVGIPARRAETVAGEGPPARPIAHSERALGIAQVPTPVPGLPIPISLPSSAHPDRWSGSFWLLARRGGGISPGAIGGELGGSQVGVRVAYLIDVRHRIAIGGWVTAPLGGGLSEAAVAIEWQPIRAPLRLLVEQRVALHGGRGGPGAAVVGGFGPRPIVAGFALEGYGEGGVIRRTRAEPYADGALRLTRRLTGGDRLHLDLGAGAWGGAQRGAERLDAGPSASLAFAAGGVPARLSLDWRKRIAGHARPASGPALTLGADF